MIKPQSFSIKNKNQVKNFLEYITLGKFFIKTLVKFKKMCNNINIIEKDNKKEEYVYTYLQRIEVTGWKLLKQW